MIGRTISVITRRGAPGNPSMSFGKAILPRIAESMSAGDIDQVSEWFTGTPRGGIVCLHGSEGGLASGTTSIVPCS